MERERDLLRRERELLHREREITMNASSLDKSQNQTVTMQRDVVERLIPNFDPSNAAGLSAEKWVQRVKNVATTNSWSQPLIVINATTMMKGSAKRWMDCRRHNNVE